MADIEKIRFEFQVFRKDYTGDPDWFAIGGREDSIEEARNHRDDYEYSRDKRTKKPQYRIVKFTTTKEVVE